MKLLNVRGGVECMIQNQPSSTCDEGDNGRHGRTRSNPSNRLYDGKDECDGREVNKIDRLFHPWQRQLEQAKREKITHTHVPQVVGRKHKNLSQSWQDDLFSSSVPKIGQHGRRGWLHEDDQNQEDDDMFDSSLHSMSLHDSPHDSSWTFVNDSHYGADEREYGTDERNDRSDNWGTDKSLPAVQAGPEFTQGDLTSRSSSSSNDSGIQWCPKEGKCVD